MVMKESAAIEIQSGDRFAFGANWEAFLNLVDRGRIEAAEHSLSEKLGNLNGVRFADVGSGSGLFSLAARNLGAEVVSFDFDPHSVACTRELRRRYRPGDGGWRIEQGSALDATYLVAMGKFDVVYSWGVLHHTGDLWTALGNVADMVDTGGILLVAIYNDQGRPSRNWRRIKQAYNRSGPTLRAIMIIGVQMHFLRAQLT